MRIRSFWRLVSLAMLACLVSTTTRACPFGTDISIQSTGLTVSTPMPFDPFSGTGVREGTTIVINNNSGIDCANVSLEFADTTSAGDLTAAGSSDLLPFKITAASGSAQLINDGSGIFVGTVAAGTTKSVDIDFVIDPSPGVVAPGNPYADSDIKLVLTSTEAAQPLDQSQQLSVSTSVETLLDINIGGASYIPGSLSAYTMNLGALSNGVTGSVNVTIRANVGHEITIGSSNGGAMVGPVPGSIETHQVPYTITFAGSSFSLGTAVTLPLGSTKTDLSGTLRSFQVQITDTGSARAGTYEDVISLTLAGPV